MPSFAFSLQKYLNLSQKRNPWPHEGIECFHPCIPQAGTAASRRSIWGKSVTKRTHPTTTKRKLWLTTELHTLPFLNKKINKFYKKKTHFWPLEGIECFHPWIPLAGTAAYYSNLRKKCQREVPVLLRQKENYDWLETPHQGGGTIPKRNT